MSGAGRFLVSVSRLWHEPLIRVDVTAVGVGVTMTLEDFVRALAAETGTDPDKLVAGTERVVRGMKAETKRAM